MERERKIMNHLENMNIKIQEHKNRNKILDNFISLAILSFEKKLIANNSIYNVLFY